MLFYIRVKNLLYIFFSPVKSRMENKQIEIDAAKMRENHLKTIIKTLRDEIRKLHKVEDDIINIEYLRNVIIKFLEKRNTRVRCTKHYTCESSY